MGKEEEAFSLFSLLFAFYDLRDLFRIIVRRGVNHGRHYAGVLLGLPQAGG